MQDEYIGFWYPSFKKKTNNYESNNFNISSINYTSRLL